MADVLLYRTPWCPFCVRAANLLRRKGIRTKEVDVSLDRRKRDWLRQISGHSVVPQIFINGVHVGSVEELYELERAGDLDTLLGIRQQAQA